MAERTAPSIGLAFAAAIIISLGFEWPGKLIDPIVSIANPILLGLGVALVIVFLGRRYGMLPRRIGSLIAGTIAVGVFVYGLAALLTVDNSLSREILGPLMAISASLGSVSMAIADGMRLSQTGLFLRIRHVSYGTGLAVLALVLGGLIPVVAIAIMIGVIGTIPFEYAFGFGILFFGLSLVLVAIWFLTVTGRGLDYIDIDWPNRWDVVFGFGGLFALLSVAIGVGIIFSLLNVPTAENTIQETAETDGAEILLLAIPLAWLAIGLGEELIFRGVIQPYLDEIFSTASAIAITSAIFALVHIPAYFSPNPVALVSVLTLIFGLSIILGWTYVKTRNLLVPIFIHGTYNAVIFLALYVTLTGEIPFF